MEQLCRDFELIPLKLAMHLLPIAASYSHTAISHFNVGAIAIGEQGDFYFGANQEFSNSAIQQTIHAEQSAISHAWLRNERRISDMVVNYTPCGHCRQFMNELHGAEKISIHCHIAKIIRYILIYLMLLDRMISILRLIF